MMTVVMRLLEQRNISDASSIAQYLNRTEHDADMSGRQFARCVGGINLHALAEPWTDCMGAEKLGKK
jgi:hypothetical protein